ncbi:MAG: hypothetical protein ABI256_05440, partial [Rhodoferax sp.]
MWSSAGVAATPSEAPHEARYSLPMSLDHPWLLWLLPLALLPLIARHDRALCNTWALLQPPDRLSGLLDWALRSVGALALAAL